MFQDTQKMIVRVLPPKPSLLNETVASLGSTQRPVSVDVGTDREDFPPLSPNFSPATIWKLTLRSAFGCMKLWSAPCKVVLPEVGYGAVGGGWNAPEAA